jgi:hypothetical protein
MQVPAIGEVLAGKYAVEAIVGRGGMGVVLAARHLGTDPACRINPFFNSVVYEVTDGIAEASISVSAQACKEAVLGKPATLSASLSASQAHQDRVPAVQSSVDVTIAP